jgi:hypothetical protein
MIGYDAFANSQEHLGPGTSWTLLESEECDLTLLRISDQICR